MPPIAPSHHRPSPPLLFPFLLIIAAASSAIAAAWSCENSCGGIPLTYPFGGASCGGNPLFDQYLNCSRGRLYLHTPTGRYAVTSIDYPHNVMVVTDSRMATCEGGCPASSASFGLQVGAPFTFAGFNEVALLGCASTAALVGRRTCDPQKQSLCASLYSGCAAISTPSSLRTSIATTSAPITVPNTDSTCCVLSDAALATAPYDINLPLLQCSAYASVYHIGAVHDPLNTWLYGIALQYYPGAKHDGGGGGGDHPSCYVCQEAEDSGGAAGAKPIGRGATEVVVIAGLLAAELLFGRRWTR